MKVGNLIGGLEVVDVKRVNKLNLIQFLKEVDNYLQQGYQIDVTSGRQVGLVLQADVYKTEAASNIDVGSTDVNSTGVGSPDVGSVGEQIPTESVGVASKEVESVSEDTSVPEPQSVQSTNVEDDVEPVVDTVKEEAPVAPKKTTTRSKKTAQ